MSAFNSPTTGERPEWVFAGPKKTEWASVQMSPEKGAKQAANELMMAYKHIVPDKPLDEWLNDPVKKALFALPNTIRRGSTGQRFRLWSHTLDAICKAARKLVPLIDLYPLEKCEDIFTSLVVEERVACTPLPQVCDRLRQHVLAFLRTFETQGEWEVVLAVRNIARSELPFTVGSARFYEMDEGQLILWGQRFSSGQYDPPSHAPPFKQWMQQEAALQGQVVAAVRVRAIDNDHARVKGRSRIEESLNLLRYGQLVDGFNDHRFPEVGLWAIQEQHHHDILIRLDQPDAATQQMIGGPEGNSYSDSRLAPGWNDFEDLLKLDLSARTELQIRLTAALQWIGQAALAPSMSIRIVALVTSLEALVIQEAESVGKKSKLSKRLSKLIAVTDAEVAEVANTVEKIYKLRSECVHAGLVDVEKSEAIRAVRVVARTLHSLLCNRPHSDATTLEEVLSVIDPPLSSSNEFRSDWIATNAYFRWLDDDCRNERHVQHWCDAEREYVCGIVLRGRSISSFGSDSSAEL